ncbi:MAG TPA: adenylate/guanylate cyclase domain-containing protein [Anaerolineales bacterium]|nr:adenylate/guanylate cyclase domain-containing protein [Anaerolineales bacterium]
MTSRPSKKFYDLLLSFSQSEVPEERHKIESALWSDFGAEYAVFVLDMSGFSMLTRKYGIVHYLSMVRRMQLTTEPIVKSYSGSMIKYEADNCFAVFPDPLAAVNAAIAMQHAFRAANLLTSNDLDIHIACGIDYGKILVVGHEDCFGDPVNRASKMGEDIACSGEILITKEAMQMIPAEAGIKAREMNLSISGITIPAYMIEYKEKEEVPVLSSQ